MANWTSFLPQATKWVSGLGLHALYGHPHKKKKAKHIKLAKAHIKNHLISAAKPAKPLKDPFRRSTGYIKK